MYDTCNTYALLSSNKGFNNSSCNVFACRTGKVLVYCSMVVCNAPTGNTEEEAASEEAASEATSFRKAFKLCFNAVGNRAFRERRGERRGERRKAGDQDWLWQGKGCRDVLPSMLLMISLNSNRHKRSSYTKVSMDFKADCTMVSGG